MKKMAVMFELFLFTAMVVVSAAGSGNYSPSNFCVEGNVIGVFLTDGSPRPPVAPLLAADGSQRPPVPPGQSV